MCSQLAIWKKMDTTKAFLTKSSSSYRRRTKYIEWDHCSSKINPYWNWKESTLWCKPHTNILAPNNTRFHFIDDKLADSRKSISSSSNCTSSSNNNNGMEGEVVVSKLPVTCVTYQSAPTQMVPPPLVRPRWKVRLWVQDLSGACCNLTFFV